MTEGSLANLRRLYGEPGQPGSCVLVPRTTSDLTPGVRWWSAAKFELVRTATGAWLFLPFDAFHHPPFAGHVYGHSPEGTAALIERKGGAVVSADHSLGRDLELATAAVGWR